MLVKITDPKFGGIKVVSTADETGLPEGGSFRLVSMKLPFFQAHHHEMMASRASPAPRPTGNARRRRG
jgi:hypothetical protein